MLGSAVTLLKAETARFRSIRAAEQRSVNNYRHTWKYELASDFRMKSVTEPGVPTWSAEVFGGK